MVAACNRGDRLTAAGSSLMVQRELVGMLDEVGPEVGGRLGQQRTAYERYALPDLAGELDHDDLSPLSDAIQRLEADLRARLTAHGVEVREYPDLPSLVRSLAQRQR